MAIVQSSVPGLDALIGGGLPRGSLTVLRGEPGTGKTNFAARFLYGGATSGERVVHASLCEDRRTFFDNMLGFDMDFETLEGKGNFAFLNLVTTSEVGVADTLETIFQKIMDMKVTRFVLDSFTALTAPFGGAIDSRIIAHSMLRKVTRLEGCTSIIISESPPGGEGSNPEEFVADNLIRLRLRDRGGMPLRELLVEKLRGREIREKRWLFTLHGGFRVLRPRTDVVLEKRAKYKALMDGDGYFSSGSEDLDRLLGGGFPKGSAVLYEADPGFVTVGGYLVHHIHWLNFIAQGRGVLIRPAEWMDSSAIKEALTDLVDEERFEKYVRVLEIRDKPPKERYVVPMRRAQEQNIEDWKRAAEELRKSTGDKPILKWTGVDRLEHLFDERTVIDHFRQGTAHTQRMGDLIIRRVPSDYRTVSTLARMSTVHLRFHYVNGVTVLSGVKPRFGPHVADIDVSEGYPQLRLTPVT